MLTSLRPTLRNVLLFMALIVGASLFFSNTTYAGPLTPSYRYEGNNKIVVSGGYLTSQADDNSPVFLNGKLNRDAEPSKSYNAAKGEIYFEKTGKANVFVTEFNKYFELTGLGINKRTQVKCYVGIESDPGSTKGKYIGLVKSDNGGYSTDGGCTDNVNNAIANTNIFDGNILGTIANSQQSTDPSGNNIPACGPTDGSCLTKRDQAIAAYETANRCYTGSTSDLDKCKYNEEIVSCLKDNPGYTFKRCADTQSARGILDGDFTGITAESTDEDIEKICELLTNLTERADCKAKAIEHRDSLLNGGENITACNIDALGWVICPFIRLLAGITDAAYEYITELLAVPTSILFVQDEDADGSLYRPWSIMRNIANVAFVIAFIIIIYSQITSMGVSNYGIKKMLPRLIISALLVNSSFWIAGLAVELSNVIGESIYNILGGADLYSAAPTQEKADWTALADTAVIGLSVGGVVGSGLLTSSILIPILLGSVLAIMIAVFVLTLRQAFIIGLIIIAPLAFVAFLLPNTEDWFKRWWKVFRTLLLLFPLIALIFGASSVASQVLGAVANTYTEPLLKYVMQAMAAGVQILPLFLTTILANITQGTLGKLTGMVNNKNKGLLDRSKTFARDRQKYRNEATKAGYGRFGKRKSKLNPMKYAGGFGRRMDKFGRTQKTDMERFDNELETDWRKSGDGGRAIQSQMNSSAELGRVKVDAEVKNITNPDNLALQAAVEASEIKLATANADLKARNTDDGSLKPLQATQAKAEENLKRAKSDLEQRGLSDSTAKQLRADTAISDARLDRTKKTIAADHSELAAGKNVGGYGVGTAAAMRGATDASVYEQMRGDSANRQSSKQRTDAILDTATGIAAAAGGIEDLGTERIMSAARATQDKADDGAVGNSIAMLSNLDTDQQVPKAVKQLKDANRSGDMVAARAATRFLGKDKGSYGQKELRKILESEQNTPGVGINPDVVEGIKAEGRATAAKGYDVALDSFFVGGAGVRISDSQLDPDNIKRIDDGQLAGQTTDVLDAWRTNNVMSSDRAKELLEADTKKNLKLDGRQRAVFKAIAAGDRTTSYKDLVDGIL